VASIRESKAMSKSGTVVFLGPTLDVKVAKELVPDALFLPPVAQSDLISVYTDLEPENILIIDGTFHQSLSVWIKEIIYCLYKGCNVYGSSSMGALRAVSCEPYGMVGYGKIFEWYRTRVTEDESEVSVSYSDKHCTVPLVNLRASFEGDGRLDQILEKASKIHYSERTEPLLRKTLSEIGVNDWRIINQKEIDAIGLLANFKSLERDKSAVLPDKSLLTHMFHAQFDRDRTCNGIPVQHIEARHLLNTPEYETDLFNSKNREIGLIACDHLGVQVSQEELAGEVQRFSNRHAIHSIYEWCSDNHLSDNQFIELLEENARIRKLHAALDSTKMRRRNTKGMLDYLKTEDRYSKVHEGMTKSDDVKINYESLKKENIQEYLKTKGIQINSTMEDYLHETGFNTWIELCTAIEREKLNL
jgi:hypothetical protein